MFPNNDEIMYRAARMHGQDIRNEVEAARDDQVRSHILRRRITVLALVGLTMVVMTLALGWWAL